MPFKVGKKENKGALQNRKSHYGFNPIIHLNQSFVHTSKKKYMYMGAVIDIGVLLKFIFFSGQPKCSAYLWKCFIKNKEIVYYLFAFLTFCLIKQYWKIRHFPGVGETKWVHSQTEHKHIIIETLILGKQRTNMHHSLGYPRKVLQRKQEFTKPRKHCM